MNNNMILHRDRFHNNNNNNKNNKNKNKNKNKPKQKKHTSYMTKETMTNKITVEKDERDKGQNY
jgi:hypothetical protein